jgi:hypothetical protein
MAVFYVIFYLTNFLAYYNDVFLDFLIFLGYNNLSSIFSFILYFSFFDLSNLYLTAWNVLFLLRSFGFFSFFDLLFFNFYHLFDCWLDEWIFMLMELDEIYIIYYSLWFKSLFFIEYFFFDTEFMPLRFITNEDKFLTLGEKNIYFVPEAGDFTAFPMVMDFDYITFDYLIFFRSAYFYCFSKFFKNDSSFYFFSDHFFIFFYLV